jgi:hypothetical protein
MTKMSGTQHGLSVYFLGDGHWNMGRISNIEIPWGVKMMGRWSDMNCARLAKSALQLRMKYAWSTG